MISTATGNLGFIISPPGLTMAALPDLFKLEEAILMLVKSGKMLANGGINYRF